MQSNRFNLIEQLKIMSEPPSSKSPRGKKGNSFDMMDISDIFYRIYEVANRLATNEGVIWIQVKHTQDALDSLQLAGKKKVYDDNDLLPPLIQTELLNYIIGKREDYLKRMTNLLELTLKYKFGSEDRT